MNDQWDIVTFGETMLRLSPPHQQLLEQAQGVEMYVGGSESNVAVGLARLGLKTAWVSALPNNPLGQLVAQRIASQGVDTSHVIWTDSGRVGLYWVEHGASPRSSSVIYDRAHSSFSQLQPTDVPTLLFQPKRARLLHLSGISPALSANAHQTMLRVLQLAKEAGWLVSFDLNYRAKLWTAERARETCHDYLQQADLIFTPQRDVQTVFGLEGHHEEDILKAFHFRYSQALIVMTIGKNGAIAITPNGQTFHASAYDAVAIDPIGAGDAFVAGFLSQYVPNLTDTDITNALRWANGAAAIKYTLRGDMPLYTADMIRNLIENSSQGHIQR